jgi:hypothetical protein
MKRESRAPLIVASIALVVMLLLYVGSYLVLVTPKGYWLSAPRPDGLHGFPVHYWWIDPRAGVVFWPLEQIDRRVRPDAWPPTDPLRPFPSFAIPGIGPQNGSSPLDTY